MWCPFFFAFSFHFLIVMGVKTCSLSYVAHVMTPHGSTWISCGSQRSAIPCCIFYVVYCFDDSYQPMLCCLHHGAFFLSNWVHHALFPSAENWTSKVWGEKLRFPALTVTFFEERLLSERKIHFIIISHVSKIDPEAFSFTTGSHHKSISSHTHMLYQG